MVSVISCSAVDIQTKTTLISKRTKKILWPFPSSNSALNRTITALKCWNNKSDSFVQGENLSALKIFRIISAKQTCISVPRKRTLEQPFVQPLPSLSPQWLCADSSQTSHPPVRMSVCFGAEMEYVFSVHYFSSTTSHSLIFDFAKGAHYTLITGRS